MGAHSQPATSRCPAPLRPLRRCGGRVTGTCSTTSATRRRSTRRTLGWTYRVVVRYKKEVLRLLSEVAFGTGALAVIGGTVVIVIFMTFFTGPRGRPAGLQLAQPARRRGLHRLHLGLLQHP